MKESWPKTPLKEVITPVNRPELVDPEKTYHILGAHWYAQGLYIKESLKGAQIRASRVYRVEEGDFVYNRLFAWKGSFAVATDENGGCYVSNEFPSFAIDRSILDPQYLLKLFSRASMWDEALGLSTGGTPTSRNRFKEEKLLAMEISLPPLEEQHRIVARIEELAARIEDARELRRRAVEETDGLWERYLVYIFDDLTEKCSNKTFRDICQVVRGGSPRPAGSPIYYDGPIPFLKVADLTKDDEKYVTAYTTTIKEAGLNRSRYVEPNTLMLTNSGATLGVPKICNFGTCFNDGIQAFLDIPNDISEEYLYYFLRSKTRWFRELIARGQGQPNLNTEMVKGMKIPLPSFQEQQQVVAYLDGLKKKLEDLKCLQDKTATELDALMPSILERAFKGEL